MSARAVICPVEEDLGGWNDIHLHDARVERMHSWLEGIGPDAFAAVLNDFCVDRIVGEICSLWSDVAGHNAAEADIDADHGSFLHGGKPRIDGIVPGSKNGDLEAFLTACFQEGRRVLEVVV